MTIKKNILLLIVCYLCLLTQTNLKAKEIEIITSFSILKSLTKEIIKKNTYSIVEENADAHTFLPTPKISQTVSKSKIIIINGLGFEGWIKRLIDASGYKGPLIIATKNILPIKNMKKGVDPHAWGDPINIKHYIIQITESMAQFMPEKKNNIYKNAKKTFVKINLLKKHIKKTLRTNKIRHNTIITAHDAFEYFGKRFSINFLSPLGLSTESEPCAKEIVKLINFIQKEKINIIFIENMTNENLIRQLAEETKIKVKGPLYSDALSKNNGPANNYFKMIKHNWELMLKSIKK